MPDVKCTVDGCSKPLKCKGLCQSHYMRLRRTGKFPTTVVRDGSETKKWLEAHSEHQGGECLTWPFFRNSFGYAVVGKQIASRSMCELRNGPPPHENLDAAHTCGNGHKGCVNPNHLIWKTRKDNMADKIAHGTSVRGEKQPQSKLSREQVLEIRASNDTERALAKKYGVHPSSISSVKSYRSWAWL